MACSRVFIIGGHEPVVKRPVLALTRTGARVMLSNTISHTWRDFVLLAILGDLGNTWRYLRHLGISVWPSAVMYRLRFI